MSEKRKNKGTGLVALIVGLVLLALAMTDIPGALAAVPVGALFTLVGIALLWPRRQIG